MLGLDAQKAAAAGGGAEFKLNEAAVDMLLELDDCMRLVSASVCTFVYVITSSYESVDM